MPSLPNWKQFGKNNKTYNIILYFMKVTHYLPLAAACLMMVGCGTGKQKAEMTAGIQLANLDTTALPGSTPVAVGLKVIHFHLSIHSTVLLQNLPRITVSRYKV